MSHWYSWELAKPAARRFRRATTFVAMVVALGCLQACSSATGATQGNSPTPNPCGPPAATPVQNAPGNVIYDEVVGINHDTRLEVFAIGGNNALWHAWQTRPSTQVTRQQTVADQWSPWQDLGLGATATPGVDLRQLAVALNGDGRLEVFAIAADGTLRHIYQTQAGTGPWSCWINESSPEGGTVPLKHNAAMAPGSVNPATFEYPRTMTALANADGRMSVVALSEDGIAWANWQNTPNAGPWCGWQDLGDGSIPDAITPLPNVPFTYVASAINSAGQLMLFAIGADGLLWQNIQTGPYAGCPSGYPMSGWSRVAPTAGMGALTSFAAVPDVEGHVAELLATDAHGNAWRHDLPVTGSGWAPIGASTGRSPLHQISGFVIPGGDAQAVALGSDGNVYDMAHVAGGSAWVNLKRGDPTSEASHLVAALNSDFAAQLFVFDNGQPTPGGPPCTGPCKGGKLWTNWHDSAGSGTWDGWQPLGG